MRIKIVINFISLIKEKENESGKKRQSATSGSQTHNFHTMYAVLSQYSYDGSCPSVHFLVVSVSMYSKLVLGLSANTTLGHGGGVELPLNYRHHVACDLRSRNWPVNPHVPL